MEWLAALVTFEGLSEGHKGLLTHPLQAGLTSVQAKVEISTCFLAKHAVEGSRVNIRLLVLTLTSGAKNRKKIQTCTLCSTIRNFKQVELLRVA